MATHRLDRAQMQLDNSCGVTNNHSSETLGAELLNGLDYFLGTCKTKLGNFVNFFYFDSYKN